ncbi:MAG: hypothetical protein ACOYOQ_15620 [Microthrixaceae bacterium]
MLQEAVLSVLGIRDPSFCVERPAAYGNVVIRHVAIDLVRGRRTEPLLGDAELSSEAPENPTVWTEDTTAGDDLRVVIEHRSDRRLWLTSAALTYLTITMFPDARPPSAPWPQAGARPDQAACWPAIWLSGRRDVFPGGEHDVRERNRRAQARSRLIKQVLDHVDAASAQWRADRLGSHG